MLQNEAIGVAILPRKQITKISKKNKKFIIVAEVFSDGIKQTEITLNPGDIENFLKLKHLCGEKIFANTTNDDYFELCNLYKSHLPEIEEELIYEINGWHNEKSFLLNNLLISPNSIKIVKKSLSSDLPALNMTIFDTYDLSKIIPLFNDINFSYVLIIYLLMSLIASKLPKTADSFSTLITIIGDSGTRKTSAISALFNSQNLPELHSSFEDSKSSIEECFRNLNDSTLIIDDLSKKNKNQAEILEKVIRLTGDKATQGKKMQNFHVLGSANSAFAIITGELLPDIQLSSLARILVLNFDEKTVNLDCLTNLQENPHIITALQVNFIRWIMANPSAIDELYNNFKSERARILNCYDLWHPRCFSTIAWFLAGAKLVNKFTGEATIDLISLETFLINFLNQQWQNYGYNDPVFLYLSTFQKMFESNEFNHSSSLNDIPDIKVCNNCLIFSNMYVYNKVTAKILQTNGVTIGNKILLRELAKKIFLLHITETKPFL